MSWNYLKEGSRVDIVAPGFKSDSEDLRKAVKILESWNLKVHIPKNLFGKHYLCAQSDEVRFAHLKEALTNSESAAIWCVRGGYGSIRLLPFLEKLSKPKNKKLLIGISDITSLHLFLNQFWKWPSLHGPLLDRIGKGLIASKYTNEMKNILFGHQKNWQLNIKALNQKAKKHKAMISGPLVGGNLTVFQSSIGTTLHPNLQGKILFLEELGERAYRIDRILQHYKQSGILHGCRAIVFGDFLSCNEPDGKNIWPQVIREWSDSLSIPVYYGLKAGHGLVQRPLMLQTEAGINSKGKLYLDISSQ